MNEKPVEIKKEDLDLTEEELQRVFFGSSDVPTAEEVKKELTNAEPHSSHVIKKTIKQLKRKSAPNINNKNIITTPDAPKPTKENDVEKPTIGRPKIWTDEKIQQLKEERRRLAQQRREQKKLTIRSTKISSQQAPTQYETEKIIDQTIKSKQEVEKFVSEKRENLKKLLTTTENPFLWNKQKCNNHIYQLHHFEMDMAVTACKNCSSILKMSSPEWDRYCRQHRKEL
jgi:hypothetical protein